MPPFPERESSILAKLKKKKGPGAVSELEEGRREGGELNGGGERGGDASVMATSNAVSWCVCVYGGEGDPQSTNPLSDCK